MEQLKNAPSGLRSLYISWAVVFTAYLVTAQVGTFFYRALETSPALIWPPVGIAFAAVLLSGYRVWPAIALAAGVNALYNETPLILLIGSVIANTLQPIIGVYILRALGFDRKLATMRDMFALLIVTFLATMIVPAVNTAAIYLYNHMYHESIASSWLAWWIGGALSALVITPLLLRWIGRPITSRTFTQYVEIAFLLFVVSLTIIFFFGTDHTSIYGFSIFYILVGAFFWIVFRGGSRYMTVALFLMTTLSLTASLYGTYTVPPGGLSARIFNTEVFDLLMAFFFFILVSIEEQRRSAIATLNADSSRLEAALRKISLEDAAKNEFIATLAHELRNPLAPLLSSIELFKLGAVSAQETDELLKIMDKRVRMMARLLDDLLDISRITQKKFSLSKEIVDLKTIVLRAIEDISPFIQKQHHTLQLSLPKEHIMVEADPIRLQQVIANLLHNAAKYMQEPGKIMLSSEIKDSNILLRVKDQGIGIALEYMDRIFEPFVQVSPTTTRAGGMGIGLSLAKHLVEMHDGDIIVRSEGENRGSEFIIRLPIYEIAPTPQTLESTISKKKAAAHRGTRILIADDNEEAAQSLSKLLMTREYVVALAYNGAETLTIAAEFDPHIILLDIGLPDMDGYEVARRLRTRYPSTMLIALTGYGQTEDKERALAVGFDFHLTKPIGLAELETVFAERHDADT